MSGLYGTKYQYGSAPMPITLSQPILEIRWIRGVGHQDSLIHFHPPFFSSQWQPRVFTASRL